MKLLALVGKAAANRRVAVVTTVVFAVLCAGGGMTIGQGAVGVFVGVGVLLGLVNLLLTEISVIRMAEGGELSRKQFGFSSLGRIVVITALSGVVALVFWPNGLGAFFGLAVFQPIALVLTGLPTLRALRKGGEQA